ncbi:MAG: YqeG family HAD IIIA-type phosphatase [Dysosmobacter sp.]
MLTPDILFDSYRDITPAFLQGQGVTLLLTDLDYTLAPKVVRRPDDALRQWIDGLKGAGITVMIVSNNRSGVRVTEFCGDLGIGYQGHAGKPSPKGLRAAMERTGTDPAHTAMLGDKLLTDMLAAHRAGVRAWMVEPLGDLWDCGTVFCTCCSARLKGPAPINTKKIRGKTQNNRKSTCNNGQDRVKYHRSNYIRQERIEKMSTSRSFSRKDL